MTPDQLEVVVFEATIGIVSLILVVFILTMCIIICTLTYLICKTNNRSAITSPEVIANNNAAYGAIV